jgi:hypothetical protein
VVLYGNRESMSGDWLFIAGDRTPVSGNRRTSVAPFLGADAEFSQGPYLMAALLDCPIYLFFCRREGGPASRATGGSSGSGQLSAGGGCPSGGRARD